MRNKVKTIVLLCSTVLLIIGCGTTKPTPKIEKLLQQNGINLKSVCIKYPQKLNYEQNGKDFSCDSKKITESMILWTKVNDKTFERVFKDPNEAIKWKKAGFSGSDVAELKQLGIGILEAKKWKEANIATSFIVLWQKNGFNVVSAKEWKNIGISSAIYAKVWIDNGFTVNDAKKWKFANIRPKEIKGWVDQGFNSLEAKEWNYIHFSPLEARKWKNAGFKALEAKKWKNTGFTVNNAIKWKEINIKLSEAKDWKDAGFTSKTTKQWKDNDFTLTQAIAYKQRHISVTKAKSEIQSRTYAGIIMDSVPKKRYLNDNHDVKFSIFKGNVYTTEKTNQVYKIALYPTYEGRERINKQFIDSLVRVMKRKYKYINTEKSVYKVSKQKRVEKLARNPFYQHLTLTELFKEVKTDKITTTYAMNFKNRGDLITFVYIVTSVDGKTTYDIRVIEYISREKIKRQKLLDKQKRQEELQKKNVIKRSLNAL